MSTNDFLKALKQNKERLTRQQVKTLRGQALSGDIKGASKGLEKILQKAV